MRAQPKKKTAKVARPADHPSSETGATPQGPFAERAPLKPIGPAALKVLREAIRSGRYPSDAVVRSGIEHLLRRSD